MQTILINQEVFRVLNRIMDITGVRGFKIINNPNEMHVTFLFFVRSQEMEHVKSVNVAKDDNLDVFTDEVVLRLIDFHDHVLNII